MTHTEESLMALADQWAEGEPGCVPARDALRLAIREVLAERDSCAGQIAEAVDQRDRQARRAEKAEAERDALAMQLKLKPAPMADCPVYCKTAVDLQAECERMRDVLARTVNVLKAKGDMLAAVVQGAKEEFVRVPYGASHEDVAAINDWHRMADEALREWE